MGKVKNEKHVGQLNKQQRQQLIQRKKVKQEVRGRGLSRKQFFQRKERDFKSKTPFQKAMQVYKDKQAEKSERKKGVKRKNEEREQAMANYKKNKLQKHKVYSQKTKKGQPVMKGRMELLLNKIKRQMDE